MASRSFQPRYGALSDGALSIYGQKFRLLQILDVRRRPAGMPAMSDSVWVIETLGSRHRFVEKRISVVPENAHRVKAEIDALKQIRSAGGSDAINVLYDSRWSKSSNVQCLLLEYANGGTLEDFLQSCRGQGMGVTDSLIWNIFDSLARALCLCHYGISNVNDENARPPPDQEWDTLCHLDIKPANVFLLRNPNGEIIRAILGDFGCVVTKRDIETGVADITVQDYGTQGWYPDECPMGRGGYGPGAYGKPTDIWQMGGVIQVMCLLRDAPDFEMAKCHMPCGSMRSKELNRLVDACMTTNPAQRPSALQIARETQKWLRNNPR